jgi:hypothetical protein
MPCLDLLPADFMRHLRPLLKQPDQLVIQSIHFMTQARQLHAATPSVGDPPDLPEQAV